MTAHALPHTSWPFPVVPAAPNVGKAGKHYTMRHEAEATLQGQRKRAAEARAKQQASRDRKWPPIENPWGLSGQHGEVLVQLAQGGEIKEVAARMGVERKAVTAMLTVARRRMGGVSTIRMVVLWDRHLHLGP